jgi:hypothetical protein
MKHCTHDGDPSDRPGLVETGEATALADASDSAPVEILLRRLEADAICARRLHRRRLAGRSSPPSSIIIFLCPGRGDRSPSGAGDHPRVFLVGELALPPHPRMLPAALARTRARASERRLALSDELGQSSTVVERPQCAALLQDGNRCRSVAVNNTEFLITTAPLQTTTEPMLSSRASISPFAANMSFRRRW